MPNLVPHELPPLMPEDVHIWSFYIPLLQNELPKLQSLLSKEEKNAVQRFCFDRDKALYTCAHSMLRLLLGHYLQVFPDEIKFEIGDKGKPQLADGAGQQNLYFNLSHSGQVVSMSFCKDEPIGIDVECISDRVDIESIYSNYFTKEEIAAFANLSKEQKKELFYYIWTRKEAILKALGTGLSTPLTAFDVLTPVLNKYQHIDWSHWVEVDEHWLIKSFELPWRYLAAIAKQHQPNEIFHWVCPEMSFFKL